MDPQKALIPQDHQLLNFGNRCNGRNNPVVLEPKRVVIGFFLWEKGEHLEDHLVNLCRQEEQ